MKDGDFAPLALGEEAGNPPGDATTTGLDGDLHAHDNIIGHLVLHAAIQSSCVLVDDGQIDVLVVRENSLYTADGSDRGIEVQFLPQLYIDRRKNPSRIGVVYGPLSATW